VITSSSVAHYTIADLSVTTTFSPDSYDHNGDPMRLPMDAGKVCELRPIAQNVLFTCSQSYLNTGGMITAAYVPASAYERGFCSQAGTGNNTQLQYREQLATVPGAMDGPLTKGCDVYWTPEDEDDCQLYQPSKQIQRHYPSIVVAGTFQPSVVPNVPVVIGRIKITTVWEYTVNFQSDNLSNATCMESECAPVRMYLSRQPHCHANWDHEAAFAKMMAVIKRAVMGGIGFYKNNSAEINALALGAGKLIGGALLI